MTIPIKISYKPTEAAPATKLPQGPEWQYEFKWVGLRCLAFRAGRTINLQSQSHKPFSRYFPELIAALVALELKSFVLDGEIVIPVDGDLSLDKLLMRIHPAASRIHKLSRETPCVFIVFNLLVNDKGKSLAGFFLLQRRRQLEDFMGKFGTANGLLEMSPVTNDPKKAGKWFHMGIGLDGIVAKRRDLPYQSGERTGMQNIKKQRTADCVVGGFRYLEKTPLIGSLLRGLYNDKGLLHHVGFTSSIRDEDRPALTTKVELLIKSPGFTGITGRSKPLEHQAFLGMRTSRIYTSRGSPIPSLHRRPLPTRNKVPALASREGPSGLHDEAGSTGESLGARIVIGFGIRIDEQHKSKAHSIRGRKTQQYAHTSANVF
jgi:ATP-dependent DNA ligase